MTKKTRRILPRGQRPMFGATLGILAHPVNCRCRPCRQMRAQARERGPEGNMTGHEGRQP
jgi:hypothetical protein